MPNIWKTDEQGDLYLETQQTRGRKKSPISSNAAARSLNIAAEIKDSKELTVDPTSFSLFSVLRGAADSISNLLMGKTTSNDDIVVRAEIKRSGMDPDLVLNDPKLYATILQGARDRLLVKSAKHAENIGEFGGTASIGTQTITDSQDHSRR